MAKSSKSMATEGLRGQVGNFVFRRHKADRKILVLHHPGEQEVESSEAQKTTRVKFQQAAIYGHAAVIDQQLKAKYQAAAKPGQSAYNVAVADFFRAPDIEEVDISGYSGQVGDEIHIKATDDFGVQQVSPRIENSDATLGEEGEAALSLDGQLWIYTATTTNESTSGDKISVTATDRPRNISREEQAMK
ncbi:MAG: hypothetical protein AB2L20_07400 [Mangrovibacterium sp.]